MGINLKIYTMKIIGVEGPSYAGKSTFCYELRRILATNGYEVLLFPCYMDAIAPEVRTTVPLNNQVTIQHQKQILEHFLAVEHYRKAEITANNLADFAILDRTFFSLLAHSHILEKLTNEHFSLQARSMIDNNYELINTPDLYIYVSTQQSVLDSRYPIGDTTLFTDKKYNQEFKIFFNEFKNSYQSVDIVRENFEITPSQVKLILSKLEKL